MSGACSQLHLNPLHAVVQLRPSMKYLDDADAKKKKQSAGSGVDGEEDIADAEPTDGATPELVALQVSLLFSHMPCYWFLAGMLKIKLPDHWALPLARTWNLYSLYSNIELHSVMMKNSMR